MKSKRQLKILELIKNKICLTQEDLQNGLKELGFDVTQSTVSRDIRELKLVKGRDEQGNYRYLANPVNKLSKKDDLHYREMFSRSAKSIRYSLNNVVVKCDVGMASSACVAFDAMFSESVLGSLAGEDTIIAVTKNELLAQKLTEEILKLI